MLASPIRAGLLAAILIGGLVALSINAVTMTLLQFGAIVLLVAFPVFFVLAELVAIRVAHRRAILLTPVWWQFLIEGHLIGLIVAMATGLGVGIAVAVNVVTQYPHALWWIGATVGMALIATNFVHRQMVDSLKPYGRIGTAFFIGPFVTAAVISAIWMILPQGIATGTLAENVAGQARYLGTSVLIGQLTDALALWSGGRSWLEDWAQTQGLPELVVRLLQFASTFGFFTGVAWFGVASLLPFTEAHRILNPSVDDPPQRAGSMGIAVAAALCFVLTWVTFGVLAGLEGRALETFAQSPQAPDLPILSNDSLAPLRTDTIAGPAVEMPLPQMFDPSSLRVMVEREVIGDTLCAPGTIERIVALDAEFALLLAAQKANVAVASGAGFDAMRANVPMFLDWYYSLSAEYLRIANLLIGNGQTYLLGQMNSYLDAGEPFAALDVVTATLSAATASNLDYLVERLSILRTCKTLPDDKVQVTVVASAPAELKVPELHRDQIAFSNRISVAGFVGAAAGVLVAKVGAKIAATSAFKAAAAALAKMAGGKMAAIGGGMLMGAGGGGVAGSVVPGAGTTIGAVVGGIVGGAAVTLGFDFGMIKLEEAISRDAFQADLIAAIDATEVDFLAQLGLKDQP